jgi:hypothetical protein
MRSAVKDRRRDWPAAMITFRSPSAHVNYWRKSGNICPKPGTPDYMKPVRYDARKLQVLLGQQQMTSYDAGIGHTLTLIALRH